CPVFPWIREPTRTEGYTRSLAAGISHGMTHPSPLSGAEPVHLHIRVIALENMAISLLALASKEQLDLARELATYIFPRPGFTQHPLTVRAAHQMIDLIERAQHFRDTSPT